MTRLVIGVVGNPNCGKTTLFNALTGTRQRIGNWPGVTVERKSGRFALNGAEVELVDLPGTYSLDAGEGAVSLDEAIARRFVAAREADLVLNIVDAANLERNLYLTTQLIEMRVPMVVVVNMMDVAAARGLSLDLSALARHLGCPVFPVVASSGEGIAALKAGLAAAARSGPVPQVEVHGPAVQAAVAALRPLVAPLAQARGVNVDWAALSLLDSDSLLAGGGLSEADAPEAAARGERRSPEAAGMVPTPGAAAAESSDLSRAGMVPDRVGTAAAAERATPAEAAAQAPASALPAEGTAPEAPSRALMHSVTRADQASGDGKPPLPAPGPAPRKAVDPAVAMVGALDPVDPAQEGGVPGTGALAAAVTQARAGLALAAGDDPDLVLADGRYGFIARLMPAVLRHARRLPDTLSDRIDAVVLNRWLGVPVFFAVMYLMFLFTINIGGALIDVFDLTVKAVAVDGFGAALDAAGAPVWLRELLATGIGGGVQVVATFIPVIAFLFLFLSVLEDSGYMARAAFVMDRAMRAVGLPGKAFVPLIVGFGCTVPAVMATRTMESHRDRILTIIMAPFMSCGARLPVYVLFAAVFFPGQAQSVVFGLYLIGIAVAVLTGLAMKSTLLAGPVTPFLMELPPYHLPTLRGIGLLTWEKTRGFILRAGRVIVPMVLVLNLLNSLGTDGSYGHADSRESVLSAIGRAITPAFAPMGLREENWPAAVGIFTGVLAKEAVVGTLSALYDEAGRADAGAGASRADDTAAAPAEPEAPFSLTAALAEAAATVPANLADALGSWADPLGLGGEIEADAGADASPTGLAMQARFDGAAGAFAYLLFVLLYFPCTAAIAAIWRETSPGWTLFIGAWTTGVAYVVAVLFYQATRLASDPRGAGLWIAAMLAVTALALIGLRLWSRREMAALTPPVAG